MKTILLLAANPRNTSPLQLDQEVREINEGLRRANYREQFKLEQKWGVRSRDFYRAILDTQPHIVHFCGHGALEDGIVLEDDTGQTEFLQADALSGLFKLFATKGVECVLLNACYSEVQANAISQHINYVIGMNQEIGDKAAINFAVAFYDALGAGEGIEFAFELGKSQLIGLKEHQIPVLKKKQGINLSNAQVEPNVKHGARIFISYKRDAEPDEAVVLEVYQTLAQQHEVFIDQRMLVGTRWADSIEKAICQADFLIVFLSARSVNSEMVEQEIRIAHTTAQLQSGRPVILPVRLGYREPFQYPLSAYLNHLNWAFWESDLDTSRLIEELRRAVDGGELSIGKQFKAELLQKREAVQLQAPFPSAQPVSLEMPEGTMQSESAFYVERPSDAIALKTIVQRGVTIAIKGARQVGKSSLLIRTIEAAVNTGKRVAFLDFQLFEKAALTNAELFFRQFCIWLTDVLEMADKVDWQTHTHIGLTQRLTLFFQKVLLVEVTSPVVIFVDEIDTTLSLSFTDDFYAAIRYLYVARSLEKEFRRLSFVLIGVATPGDLIRDPKRTPFNIGQRVDLTDFTFEEAKPLAEGLGLPQDEAQQVLSRVLLWTGGHPYLTQRLCSTIREKGKNHWSKADIDSMVSSTFLGAMSEQDNNLQFVRDMLTKRAPDAEVLTTYQEIRTGKRPVLDEEQSIVKSHLKLSGVVRHENHRLCIRNPIYRKVFDDRWLKEHLPVPFQMLMVQRVLLTSLIVTLLTLGIRQLGVLESLELKAFDQMMQKRGDLSPDPRILIVGFTEGDIQKLQQGSPNGIVLDQILSKLERHQPKAIGLDFFRDVPVQPGHEQLLTRLKQDSRIIPICSWGGGKIPDVPPPTGIKSDNTGFANIPQDKDGVIRRNLLVVTPNRKSSCATPASLGLQLALEYLKVQPEFTKEGNLKLGKTIFQRLQPDSGGYQQADTGGFQILLNYRGATNVAQQVSITDMLNDRFKSSWVKNRIVLIGSTAPTSQDIRNTPYSDGKVDDSGKMPGVVVHAHMVSQLLDAVSDERPLFWFWPVWEEFLWTWGWAVVGSFIAWRIRNLWLSGLAQGSALGILYGLSFALFTQSGWIPLIPPALALVVTSGSVVASHISMQKQQRLKISNSLINKLEISCTLRGEQMTDVIARLITMYIEQNIPPTKSTNERSKKSKN